MVDISPIWQRLRRDLGGLAQLANTDGERLTLALEPALRLRLLEAISAAAAEIEGQLPGLSIKTSLTDDGVAFEVQTTGAQEVAGELDARITLRLPEELKLRIETAAARSGLSLNTWLVRELTRSTTTELTIGKTLRGRGSA